MTKRKPYNVYKGYVASKIYQPTKAYIVIYRADEQGIDVDGNKFAIVCEKHKTLVGAKNLCLARQDMKFPEFCEDCMKEEGEHA